MQLVTQLLAAGLLAWFGLLALIIFGRVLKGDIDTAGIMQTRQNRAAKIAPERVISILVFPVVIVSYAYTALHADMSIKAALPELPEQLLMMLTGGNGLYLAGKIARTQ